MEEGPVAATTHDKSEERQDDVAGEARGLGESKPRPLNVLIINVRYRQTPSANLQRIRSAASANKLQQHQHTGKNQKQISLTMSDRYPQTRRSNCPLNTVSPMTQNPTALTIRPNSRTSDLAAQSLFVHRPSTLPIFTRYVRELRYSWWTLDKQS
jgi:hypothetical protein